MTTSVTGLGSDSLSSSAEAIRQNTYAKSLASFQSSLVAAQQSLLGQQDDDSSQVSRAMSALSQYSASPLSQLASSSATSQGQATNSLSGSYIPTATVRSSTNAYKQSAATQTASLGNVSQSTSSGKTSTLDSIRARTSQLRQRLTSLASTNYRGQTLASATVKGSGQTKSSTTTNTARVGEVASDTSKVEGTTSSTKVGGTSSGAMTLADYPRPVDDNGRGMDWVPTVSSDNATVDRFVNEMVDMKIKWAVILNDGTNVGDNDYLVQQLVANDIEPVMRIYTDGGKPIEGDIQALVKHYKAMGVSYYQLYNEPNLNVENQGAAPNVNKYLDLWIPAAKEVTEAGGLPGFGSLAPGGNYDDIQFFKEALDGIKSRGETKVLDNAWISMHNYTLNHPLDYTTDSNGFLKYQYYDQIVKEKLGRSLPIIGTEGGTHVGASNDKSMSAITEAKQVEMVVGAMDSMQNAPDAFFANTYWLIANQTGGGADKEFEWQALFKKDGTSPVVDALKKMDLNPRDLPVSTAQNTNNKADSSANTMMATTMASTTSTKNGTKAASTSSTKTGNVASTKTTTTGSKANSTTTTKSTTSSTSSNRFGQSIVDAAMKYVGSKYVWGGEDPSGFDCTGFTWYTMQQLGHSFPLHDLQAQMDSGKKVSRADLQPGDLVFFQNTYQAGLSHVGIYIGNNRFVHAASERYGVMVSSLDDAYWSTRYYGATRVAA